MSNIYIPSRSLASVNPAAPINWECGLNRGLDWWWLEMPYRTGGVLRDLCNRYVTTYGGGIGEANKLLVPHLGVKGVDFDGTDDRVSMSLTEGEPDISGLEGWTFSTWLSWDETAGDEHTILGNWNDASTSAEALIRLEPAGNNVEFFVVLSSGFVGGTFSGVTVPGDGTWTHITARMDASAGLHVWVNGIKSSTTVATGNNMHGTKSLDWYFLGVRKTGAGTADEFNGRLADTRLWKRGLTDVEAIQIYEDSLTGYQKTLNRSLQKWIPNLFVAAQTASLHIVPKSKSLVSVDKALPINRECGLNRGLAAWLLGLPSYSGGSVMKDLCRKWDGDIINGGSDIFIPTPRGDYAVNLDGTALGEYINLGGVPVYATPVTMSLWIDVHAVLSNAIHTIIAIGDAGAANDIVRVFYDNRVASRGLVAQQYDGSTAGDTPYVNVPIYAWHQITAVFAANNLRTLYYDGVQIAQNTTIVDIMTTQDYCAVGVLDWSGGPIQYINQADVADIRIWDRALSSEDVQAVYHDSLSGYQKTLNRSPRYWMSTGEVAASTAISVLRTMRASWLGSLRIPRFMHKDWSAKLVEGSEVDTSGIYKMPESRSLASVDKANPVNMDSGLNTGLRVWWLGLPHMTWDSNTIRPIYDKDWYFNGTMSSNYDSADCWRKTGRGDYALHSYAGQSERTQVGEYNVGGKYTSLNGENFGVYTVGMWVQFVDPFATNNYQYVFAWDDGSTAGRRVLVMGKRNSNTPANRQWVVYWDNGNAVDTLYSYVSGAATNDTWYYQTFTYDIGLQSFYVNGVLEDTGVLANPCKALPDNHLPPYFSYTDYGTGAYYSTRVSDFRVWDHPLSANEVRQVYIDSLTGYQKTLNRSPKYVPSGETISVSPAIGREIPASWIETVGTEITTDREIPSSWYAELSPDVETVASIIHEMPKSRSLASVDKVNPVNWNSPLNTDRRFWQLGLPSRSGGFYSYELVTGNLQTLFNMGSTNWVPTGRGDFGLDYDGSTERGYSTPSNIDFGNGSNDEPFSISAWIKADEATNFQICDHRSSSVYEYLFYTSSADVPGFALFDETASHFIWINSDVVVVEGEWTHIEATYDGSSSYNGLTIYVNGLVTTFQSGAIGSYVAMHGVGEWLWIGSRTTITEIYSDGQIADLSIWGGEHSAAQVWQNYTDSLSGHTKTLNRTVKYFPASKVGVSPTMGREIPASWIEASDNVLATDRDIPVGWKGDYEISDTIPKSWISDIETTRTKVIDIVAEKSIERTKPASWAGDSDITRVTPPSWTAEKEATRTTPPSWIADITHKRTAPESWTGGYSSERTNPASYLGAGGIEDTIPVSWQGSVAISEPRSIPVSWLTELSLIDVLPIGFTSSTAITRQIPLSWLGGVLSDRTTPVSWVGSDSFKRQIVASWRAALGITRTIPFEWKLPGSFNIFREIPVSWKTEISHIRNIHVDFLSSKEIARVAPASWLGELSNTSQIPLELLGGNEIIRTMPAEWGGTVLVSAIQSTPIEHLLDLGITSNFGWSNSALMEITRAAHISWLRNISINQTEGIEYLASAGLTNVIPVEWMSITELALLRIIPIEYGGITIVLPPITWTLCSRPTIWTPPSRDVDWTLAARGTTWTLPECDADWTPAERGTTWTLNDR